MDVPPGDVARIVGPLLISYLIDWGLFGVLSMQVYVYYLAFAKDPLINRLLVYGVYLFMVVQSILFSKSAFQTFGPGFGNLQTVDDITHIWFSVPIMCSVVALVVQGYYASTIYFFSKDKRIVSVIVVLSVIQLAGGVFTGVVGHGAHTFSKFLDQEAEIATAIWNTAGALCDIIIALFMSYYYLSANSQWKLRPTRVPIFIRVLVQSGALLAAIASLNTVLIQLKGRTYYQTTSGILGNTYANTLLALLNSRARLARPNGYTDDEISGTYVSQQGDYRPPRSALVFAKPTLVGEGGTQTEVGMETQIGHGGRGSRLTSTSGMTEGSRTMASADMDEWDEHTRSTPKEDTALSTAQPK